MTIADKRRRPVAAICRGDAAATMAAGMPNNPGMPNNQ